MRVLLCNTMGCNIPPSFFVLRFDDKRPPLFTRALRASANRDRLRTKSGHEMFHHPGVLKATQK
jgi:hypothetical protein